MASFTDNQPIQFNPYIQQIPVDEYTRAGLMKQEQYNQGVQRVQQYVDYVTGLPVVGEANKALLTEKIGQLKQKVQGVIRGDFSKMNLQMQIGNLAAQVAKDPAIMSSVESAKKIQALEMSIAESRKSGKGYSAANEAYVRDHVNQFVQASNKEAGLSYNGPVNMHNVTADDVHKKIREAIAPLKGMEDIDYSIASNGEVMLKKEDKILDGTRIKAAIEAVLTSDDRKALSIDGWYNTYGLTDQQIVNEAGSTYTDIGNRAMQMHDYYKNIVLGTPGMSNAQKEKYENIALQHKVYADSYYKLANDTKNSISTGRFDREAIAGMFNLQKMENSYAGMYQFRQSKEEKELDPEFDVWYKKNDMAIKQYDAETARMKEEREAKAALGGGGGTIPITVDPDSEKYQKKYSSGAVQEKIAATEDELFGPQQSAKDKALMAYATSLIDMLDPNSAELSGLVPDAASPSGYRWKSKEARAEVEKKMNEGWANYNRAAIDPNFKGIVPLVSKPGKQAHFDNLQKAVVLDKMKEADAAVAKSAIEGDKTLRGIKDDFYRKVQLKKADGTTEEVTVGTIINLVKKLPETNRTDLGMASGVAGVGAMQSKADRDLNRDKPTEAEVALAKYDRREVNKLLSEYGLNIDKVNEAKDKLYKLQAELVNPRMRQFSTSEKETKANEYRNYQSFVSQSDLFKGGGRDVKGNKLPDEAPATENINIEGAYRDMDGTLKFRVSWVDKKKGTVRADVDATDYSKTLPANSWLGSKFMNDSHPELTESLRRPGTSSTTPFDEKNMFQGSLFVTGNDNVARRYMIAYDRNNDSYKVVVAIPTGNGQFRKQVVGPASGYPHAGAAIAAIEYQYSGVTEKYPVTQLESDIINASSN